MDVDSCSMRVMALLGALALVVACADDGPTRVSLAQAEGVVQEAFCEQLFECSCDGARRYDDIAQCREVVRAEVDEIKAAAANRSLTYDPTCVGARVDGLEELGCDAVLPEPPEAGCDFPCRVLHGDVPFDGACSQFGTFDDCAAGLDCEVDRCDEEGDSAVCTGRCVHPCYGGCPEDCGDDARCDRERGRCVDLPGAGRRCDRFGLCDSDSICDYAAVPDPAGQCVALPGAGGSCADFGRCAGGLRCNVDPDGTVICVGPTADAEPCSGHLECESGNCPAGFCAPLPGAGDSCAGTRICAPGLVCDEQSQRCADGPPALCGLSVPL